MSPKNKKQKVSHKLGDVVWRELGVQLNKEHQASDWGGELTPDMLLYAGQDQDQVDWITPEKRQDYYRRMKLKVDVYQDDEPALEISGIPVCQNGSIRNSPSR